MQTWRTTYDTSAEIHTETLLYAPCEAFIWSAYRGDPGPHFICGYGPNPEAAIADLLYEEDQILA